MSAVFDGKRLSNTHPCVVCAVLPHALLCYSCCVMLCVVSCRPPLPSTTSRLFEDYDDWGSAVSGRPGRFRGTVCPVAAVLNARLLQVHGGLGASVCFVSCRIGVTVGDRTRAFWVAKPLNRHTPSPARPPHTPTLVTSHTHRTLHTTHKHKHPGAWWLQPAA